VAEHSSQRLGASGRYDVKHHPFFSHLDWHSLERGVHPPPFLPNCNEGRTSMNFDPAPIWVAPVISATEAEIVAALDQSAFEGFSYAAPQVARSKASPLTVSEVDA